MFSYMLDVESVYVSAVYWLLWTVYVVLILKYGVREWTLQYGYQHSIQFAV